MKNFYATIILTLSFINLAFSQTSSMDFYFDLDNFAIPKVYVFTNHERNQIEYWEFISDTSKNQLTSICYNSNLQEYNKFVEQYNDKKSILLQYTDYIWENEDKYTIDYNIIQNEVMSWDYTNNISYEIDDPNGEGGFIKIRNILGDTVINVLGNDLESLVIEDKIVNSKGEIITVFRRYYSKGVGLVKMVFNEEKNDFFELVGIIDSSVLRKILDVKK